ncbi:RNA 2',3'-cyclic phosphodiesterase [Candidatus Bipolaricaulota sp. J31]
MRLFFCVELEDDAKRELEALMERLRPRCGHAKWVARDNLHLTVRFLGEVDERRLGELETLAREVTRDFSPFTLELETLSAFPSPRRARVLWVGPRGDAEEFVALMRSVEDRLRRLGFRPETREPKVHVTLARFKLPQDLSGVIGKLGLSRPLRVEVRELTLMRSELRPEGPIYTPVFRVPLGGN